MRSKTGTIAVATCVALLAGVLGDLPAQAATPILPGQWTVATINLATDALDYDPLRRQLLVVPSGAVPQLGKSLVEIDPADGSVGRSVALGSGATDVTVADDGSRVYVGLTDSPAVAEVDLATFTLTRRIPLGTGGFLGYHYSEDVEVQPGDAGVIAVSRRNRCCSPRHEGVVVYDEGVPRRLQTQGHTGSNRITWSANPALLYGYNNETSEFGLREIRVDEDGADEGTVVQVFGGYGPDIEYYNDRIHATNGQVVDAATLLLDGSYQNNGLLAFEGTKTYFLNSQGLHQHDGITYLKDWTVSVPALEYRTFVEAGDVFAARTADKIVLVGPNAYAGQFVAPTAPASVLDLNAVGSLALRPSALTASPDGSKVYATVRSDAPTYPGELVEVDVATRAVERRVFVGASPNRVAASADGSRLIVGHSAANRITEVDVATFTIARTVPLQAGEYADDIAPRPGHPDGYAAQLIQPGMSPSHLGVIYVEGGQIQPARTPGHTGPTAIAFVDDPNRLYGHNGGHTGFGFYVVGVSATGVSVLEEHGRLLEGFDLQLRSGGPLLYASNGGVVDPSIPLRVGQLDGSGIPLPLRQKGRVIVARSGELLEFDTAGRWRVGVRTLPAFGTLIDAQQVKTHLVLAFETSLRFVPVIDPDNPPPSPPPSPPPPPPPPPATFRSSLPVRIHDTRGSAKPPAGNTTVLHVAGNAGVPANAKAAVLNVTVVGPDRGGYATVYPCDGPRPNASNLNYRAGQTVANAVIARLSATGTACVYATAGAYVVVDVTGHVPAAAEYVAQLPARIRDTRSGTKPSAGSTTVVQVVGRSGVPSQTKAAVLNVTIVGPASRGYATVYPCDQPRPVASNVNFEPGETIAGAVVAKLSAAGATCIHVSASAHVVADLNGHVPAASAYVPQTPRRLRDTRSGTRPAAGSVTVVQVTGRNGVPKGATTAVLNVAAVSPLGGGYISVYPCDSYGSRTSTLNYRAGATIANLVVARLSAQGTVCIFTSTATHLIADLNGHDPGL